MSIPTVTLRLLGDSRSYAPGDTLQAEYRMQLNNARNLKAVEKSILWYTEGKGEEDLGIHFFDRTVAEDLTDVDLNFPMMFSSALPASPLSYDGIIVRVHWCARVRVFLSRGRQLIAEQPFKLGSVPPSMEVSAEKPTGDDDDSTNPGAT